MKVRDTISELLREAGIKEDARSGVIGVMIVALWYERQDIQRHVRLNKNDILGDLQKYCDAAFAGADKSAFAATLSDSSSQLKSREDLAIELYKELKKAIPNTSSMDADFIGELYEKFFRYSGTLETLHAQHLL